MTSHNQNWQAFLAQGFDEETGEYDGSLDPDQLKQALKQRAKESISVSYDTCHICQSRERCLHIDTDHSKLFVYNPITVCKECLCNMIDL